MPAWNASLNAGITLVTPAAFTFTLAARDYDIVFMEDEESVPTAVSHMYLL